MKYNNKMLSKQYNHIYFTCDAEPALVDSFFPVTCLADVISTLFFKLTLALKHL